MSFFNKIIALPVVFALLTIRISAQEVYQFVRNESIYEFLDELANEGIIELNSAVKPYSRRTIASKLMSARLQPEKLSVRQQKELTFYLRDYNKEISSERRYEGKRFDLFYYRDSLFTFSLNPVLGGNALINKNDFNYTKYNGAEAFAYIGKHVGIYASLVDYQQNIRLVDTGIMTPLPGGVLKGTDYSDMRGGINVAWKWGNISVIKDYNTWGNYYTSSNILSDKAPSYAQLKLVMNPARWFEFTYIHGWMISDVVDSSRSYSYNGIQRNVFHDKNIAANIFTFIPKKGLSISVGNSVIYSDKFIHVPFLIPVMFFKSVDHTYNNTTNAAGQNSQMFFDISCRLIPKTHIFYSMFLDELSFERMFDETRQSNHWSMKWGGRISNLIPDVKITAEYTRTNPLAYKNDNITTLFNSNWYNLGHYLLDNADELYVSLGWKPHYKIETKAYYRHMRKGPDYRYDRSSDPVTGNKAWGRPFMETVEWEMQVAGIKILYQILNDMYIHGELALRKQKGNQERYSSEFYYGDTTTFSFGMNYGF